MKEVTSRSTTAAMAFAAGLVASDPGLAQEQYVVIGTGGVTGVYYPIGGAIQRLVNANRSEHGIQVSVQSTGGSISNLYALAQGEMDMGIVRSDWQYHSYHGSQENFPNANPDLRAVFSVHGQPFTVVARADSGIETFEDLIGERLNIGNPGSGARVIMETLMEAYGWDVDDFAEISELAAAEQGQALCDNNVDAVIFTVRHPSATIHEATTSCDSRIVPVEGAIVDQLIIDNPFYAYSVIPGGMYANNSENIVSFGTVATFVTTTALSDEIVYTIVASVFDNLEDFKQLHPAFAMLGMQQMACDGHSVPWHNGARRFYEEAIGFSTWADCRLFAPPGDPPPPPPPRQ